MRIPIPGPFLLPFLLAAGLGACTAPDRIRAGQSRFAIQVVDAQTGRGVPLVELETVNHVLYVTDSNGLAAVDEPGLMGHRAFFSVRSHGYAFPADGFGNKGVALRVEPGSRATVKLERRNIAERLYRVTGEGIYRDSVLLGDPQPLREPLLNAQVAGQDSAQAVPYLGRIHWFWGDTTRPGHPLGQFQTSGATSQCPGQGGLAPGVGVDLDYFTDADGFSKRMVPLKEPGMVWIDGLLTVPDETGRERLVAHYSRMKSLGERLEHGLVVFNDAKQEFEKLAVFDLKDSRRCPRGHPVKAAENGVDYFYFPDPFCDVRVRATLADLKDPGRYEILAPTPPPALTDADSGRPVRIHGGSVAWNAHRRRWILVGNQIGGASSFLGEVWYAEAKAPTGPWGPAKKIATHDRHSFYNPVHHPFFDEQGGRVIYFEGTYANMFSGNPVATPRYDYNQLMYRLDLDDPRLGPARK